MQVDRISGDTVVFRLALESDDVATLQRAIRLGSVLAAEPGFDLDPALRYYYRP